MSPEGVGGDPDDVGVVVVGLEDDGVSGAVGAVEEEYDDRDEEGGGIGGGGAIFVRMCGRDCFS